MPEARSFREHYVPEARFPRRTLSGNLVNIASVQTVDPKTSMKARGAFHKDLRLHKDLPQKVVRAMVVFGFSEPVRTIHGQPLRLVPGDRQVMRPTLYRLDSYEHHRQSVV